MCLTSNHVIVNVPDSHNHFLTSNALSNALSKTSAEGKIVQERLDVFKARWRSSNDSQQRRGRLKSIKIRLFLDCDPG